MRPLQAALAASGLAARTLPGAACEVAEFLTQIGRCVTAQTMHDQHVQAGCLHNTASLLEVTEAGCMSS